MARDIPLSRGLVAIVDDADFALLSRMRWNVEGHSRNLYARSALNGVTVKMHRLILGAEAGQVVDHINGNTLDNRRANLRFATTRQNLQNRKAGRGRPYKGIFQQAGRWYARISKDGKPLALGGYATAEEAAAAYDAAAIEIHGEFVRLNLPKAEAA